MSIECPDIGTLLKVEVGCDQAWHLHLVRVAPEDALELTFPAMRWLDARRGDGLTILSLLVRPCIQMMQVACAASGLCCGIRASEAVLRMRSS